MTVLEPPEEVGGGVPTTNGAVGVGVGVGLGAGGVGLGAGGVGLGVGGASGVTELEFEEGLPVPTELMAETLNI